MRFVDIQIYRPTASDMYIKTTMLNSAVARTALLSQVLMFPGISSERYNVHSQSADMLRIAVWSSSGGKGGGGTHISTRVGTQAFVTRRIVCSLHPLS